MVRHFLVLHFQSPRRFHVRVSSEAFISLLVKLGLAVQVFLLIHVFVVHRALASIWNSPAVNRENQEQCR